MGLEEMLLQKGDLINVRKRPGLISWIIREVTKSEYSHSAMYAGDGKILEADWEGIIESDLSKYDHYDVYRHTQITPEQQDQVVDWMRSKIGKKYDYWGVFGILVGYTFHKKGNPFDDKDKYWCSESFADSYINKGVYLCVNENTLTVSPQDLADCENMKLSWIYDKDIEK